MRAVALGSPALERASSRATWRLTGGNASAAYLTDGRFVIALTAPGVPFMPNGIAVEARPDRWPDPGTHASAGPGLLRLGAHQVTWDRSHPPIWDGRPRRPATPADRPAVRRRGEAILRHHGVRPRSDAAALAAAVERPELADLLSALSARDAALAQAAADAQIGNGPGLTPEGDDVLCGVAAVVARFATTADWTEQARADWLAALVPADVRERTSDLSATLLELACAGDLAEPAHAVLTLENVTWTRSLRRLMSIGGSTGRAYAIAIGCAAWLLGSAAGS